MPPQWSPSTLSGGSLDDSLGYLYLGGFPVDCLAGGYRMPLILLLWLLAFPAHAAYQSAIITGMTTSANGLTWRSSAAAFTNSAANTQAYFNSFGTRFTVPAVVRASTKLTTQGVAGQLLARSNPWVIGAATSLWLIQQGLQLVNGETVVAVQPDITTASGCSVITGYPNAASLPPDYMDWWSDVSTSGVCHCGKPGYGVQWPCTARATNTPVTYRPLTQDDLGPIYLRTPSDVALGEISRSNDGLPVDVPTLSPTDVPISAPRLNPDGSTSQERAKITPSPTDDDPLRVRIDTYDKQLTDSTGAPIPEPDQPATDTDTEKQQSECEKHPETLGCAEWGEAPAGETVSTTTRPVTFSPVALAGAPVAACPAPVTFTIGGHSMGYDFDVPCRYADMFRPIILAMAWLGAAYVVVVGARES